MGTDEAVKEVGSASHSPRRTPITLAIYRDLRVGMVVIMVMLAAALVIDRRSATQWQSTLSDYYYTSAHCIFIAALLALSTLFFIYRGSSDTEDALLTLAGVGTLIAALVPEGRPSTEQDPRFLPKDYDVVPFIRWNVLAVVVALFLGWSLLWWLHGRNNTRPIRSAWGTLSLWLLRLIVLFGLIAMAVFPEWFKNHAHGAAGFLMVSAFIVTVIHAAYLAGQEDELKSPHRHGYRLIYSVIAVLMLVTLITVVTLHLGGAGWVIVLESLLILEFAAYWVVQTIELWDSPDRSERLPEDARKRLAEGRGTRGLRGLKSELFEARTDETRDERLLRLL
jgi:hypothetical protein